MSNVNLPHLGFNPDLATYTPEGGFSSTWAMMYLYAVISFVIVICLYCWGLFRPSCNLKISKSDLSIQSITSRQERKYNNAGWHFLFVSITWFIFAIRHHLNEEDVTSHLIVQVIWSIFYHLTILFYLLSIGPPPDSLKINATEWIVYIGFVMFLIITSFIVDTVLLQSMFCYLLWFCCNWYLFICTLIELYIDGCSKTPFFYHSSVLFTTFAMIIVFVSFHFFKGFESSHFVNNYVLIIGCFIISSLFYFGALVLESNGKEYKQYDGNSHIVMSSFGDDYNQQMADYEEIMPINLNHS